MGKQQQNDDNLFADINIDDLDQGLITVGGEEGEDFVEEPIVKKDAGTGDPGKEKPKEPEPKPEELIEVGAKEEEEEEEKNIKKQQEEKKLDEDTKGGSTPEEDSPVYLHAATLQENGVLPNFDLNSIKELDPDQAILKINEHIQAQINDSIAEGLEEYKKSIGERALEIAKALEEGVDYQDLSENLSLEQRFGEISAKTLEGDEQLQEAVYADYLAMKGFSDAKIKRMVDLAREKEELLTEASEGLGEIKDLIVEERKQLKSNAEKAKKDREEKNTKTKELINKTVNEIKEIIPGIEVTEKEKKDLVKMLTVPVKFMEGQNGQRVPISASMDLRSKDPVAYELRLNYLISKGFFEKDMKNLKLETFMKKAETAASKKLIEKLSSENKVRGGKITIEEREKEEKEKNAFMFPQEVYA